MGDILEIRLQHEAGADFVLIHGCDESFVAAGWPTLAIQLLKIGIERLCPGRDTRIAAGDTEFILGSLVAKTNKFDPCISVEVDDVAVRRAVGCPREDADAPVVVLSDAIDLLLEHGVNAEIAR
jgi:hypothetical protein